MQNRESELEKLRKLYESGVFKPDFYSRNIPDSKVFNSYENFQNIPFSYKRDIRNATVDKRTTTKPEDIFGIFSSSGTTGEKTFYIYNRNDKKVHEEFVKTYFTELGVTPEDIGAIMAPIDTTVIGHAMMWQFTVMGAAFINCPVPSPENMIETVTKAPVTIIATRPSIATGVAYNPLLQQLAQSSKVNKLLMGGGTLSEERRKLLEYSWNAECYNCLGMSEVFGPLAAECRCKDGLHYRNDYLMIEIVDPDTGKPVEEGEPGIAVYTTLWDKGFPLLRYWTDDFIRITNEPCKCGSPYPRLYHLGRRNDCYVIDGKYIFPEMAENILFKHGYIGDFCIERGDNGNIVRTEAIGTSVKPEAVDEMSELLHSDVSFEILAPGSLKYDGHARRFLRKNICE